MVNLLTYPVLPYPLSPHLASAAIARGDAVLFEAALSAGTDHMTNGRENR
jgi:hypothetical protein